MGTGWGIFIFIFFISFLFANSINAPPARQVCLQDCTQIYNLTRANSCEWKFPKEGDPWFDKCSIKAVLLCTVQDSTNAQYNICPEVPGLAESKWSPDSAKKLFETDTANCNLQETHMKSCHYSPERVDGNPMGDHPNMPEGYCRIPLKPQQPNSRAR